MPSMTLTCFICNLPMQQTKTSKAQGVAAHNECRRKGYMGVTHGTSGYRAGCRCDECKAGQAAKMRAYADKVQAERGAHPTTLARRRFKEANGYWPQAGSSAWIDPQLRQSLYERDGWNCHICGEAIDRGAHWNADRAPSLDHIIPRSSTLIPDHSPANLKTAHRVCNSIRGTVSDGWIQPEANQRELAG